MASSLRIVIVSDTHGALDDRIADEAMRSDIVVHAGDIGSPEVLEALTPQGGRLIAVRGNNDWQLEIRQLPVAVKGPAPADTRMVYS